MAIYKPNLTITMYNAKEFNLPELSGISKNTIAEHLGLYQGYVKNVNLIHDLINQANDHNTYALKEAHRRLGFEFGGMRNHEYYFGALEDGSSKLGPETNLFQKITDQFGSYADWLAMFKGLLATQRGVGWAMLGYDTHTDTLLNYWVDEQHQGHLTGVQPLLALDMWEHAYCMDYAPSKKADYVSAYLDNINWSVIENWYNDLVK